MEHVLQHIRNGGLARRASFPPNIVVGQYLQGDSTPTLFYQEYEKEFTIHAPWHPMPNDVIADDWEIYTPG